MYHSFEHCNITPHQHNQSHLIFPFNIHAPKMIKDTHVKYICNLVISCSKHWVEEMSIYPSSHFVKSMAKPWCWQNISLLLIWKESSTMSFILSKRYSTISKPHSLTNLKKNWIDMVKLIHQLWSECLCLYMFQCKNSVYCIAKLGKFSYLKRLKQNKGCWCLIDLLWA